MKYKKQILLFSSIIVFIGICIIILETNKKKDIKIDFTFPFFENVSKKEKDDTFSIKISAVGDCTIGSDTNFGYRKSFYEYYDENGAEYFFYNVRDLFKNDDITIANLEGTFTNSNVKRVKQFNFKAAPEYVNILKKGSVELVNIANNHTYDYNQIGYDDTINTLKTSNINFVGEDYYYFYDKENIRIGFAGIACYEDISCTRFIDKALNKLKENNPDLIVISFHWGIEKAYKQSYAQTYLAHYAIDNGADLILGHHPHVLEGIELYKNKYIVYSLGNFVFGGNSNPSDKDSMIFQIEYKFHESTLIDTIVNIYPVSISSKDNINDYRPTILTDEAYERVLSKIEKYSIGINLK